MFVKEHSKQLIMSFEAKDRTRVILRPASVDDAQAIVDGVKEIIAEGTYLQKEAVRTVSEEKQFIEDMIKKNNMYTVIEVNGEVMGIARIIRGELKMKSHTGIFRTWLRKDAQGKGIGSRVMEYSIQWGQQNQLHKICLTVFARNAVATKLYKKYGFIEEGVQREQVIINGSFDDEIFMARFLNDSY
ncbi:GNAT family N-acetyltransferase [Desertibacillus haloalkaliphilus]|uniref:GNAT family N-acetyltransferase n=1 Tax=Desertibacillus haloalkaliphilus TaxID=1328930 RepID=UPI001C273C52|nr:GNAT family protein [Desertibacillus haloalkaliphilus]MBU8907794.1 GNAT family N-acetyltransferase [Desertibacillus haloalkaliphilus]